MFRKNGDLFQLLERFDTMLNFNADNRISSLRDADGNQLNLSYSGGKLTKVTDAFNRSLTFNYSGELLTSVADSTGSSTGFAYDTNGDLVSFTDQENNVWQYGYDTGHRMTSLTNLLMAS